MNPCVYVDRTIYVSLIQLAKYFAFSEAVSQHLLFTVDSQLKRNKILWNFSWVYALKNLSRMQTIVFLILSKISCNNINQAVRAKKAAR